MTAVATAIERIASSSGDYLNLKGLGLTTADVKVLMPMITQKLPHLKHLNLSNNTFDTLPPEIGNLSELLTLKVSQNHLTALPPEIGNLLQLQALDASKNNLMQLPDAIGNLSALFTFNISGNNLTVLPDTIENLSRLTMFDVSKNYLVQLPPGISKLINLMRLILDDNRLTQFPESIAEGLSRLIRLSLIDNPLSQETIQRLTNRRMVRLRRIVRHHNKVEKYKAVLHELYNGEEGTAQEMITLIETANEGDAEKQELAKILKEFLEKMPDGQGPVQEVYDKTVKHLLQEIKNGDKDTAALIKTSLGNCATPVKSFLLQTAIGLVGAKDGENKIDIDPKILDQLIAREALQEKVIQVLEGKLSRNEAIEAVQGLLNALFLAGAEENSENKIKISGERLRLPSTSAYPDFAFTQVREKWIEPFAKLCCKTDADGTLQKDNKGNYSFDSDKLSKLTEEYRNNLNIFSLVGEEVVKFKTAFEKELKKYPIIFSDLENPDAKIYMDYDDENNPIPILRNILLGFKPDMYEKIRQQFLKTVKGKLQALNQEWEFVEKSEAALEKVSEEYEKMFTSEDEKKDPTLKKLFDLETKKETLKRLIKGEDPERYDEMLQGYLNSLKKSLHTLKELHSKEGSLAIPLSHPFFNFKKFTRSPGSSGSAGGGGRTSLSRRKSRKLSS